MIELANDPNASRSFQRAAANDSDGKDAGADGRRGRSAHAWPFLSPCAARPARQESSDKPAANDSGS
ncbi:MAG TPA: hypothetical protein VMZ74_05630 [Ramlibacter sp.]|nr:hypothetical protein [Ramlibacter sp.]